MDKAVFVAGVGPSARFRKFLINTTFIIHYSKCMEDNHCEFPIVVGGGSLELGALVRSRS